MSQIVGLTATWQDKVEGNPMRANTASNAKVNISPVHTEFNFFRNFLFRQRRHEDGDHHTARSEINRFHCNYLFLAPKIKLQNFENH